MKTKFVIFGLFMMSVFGAAAQTDVLYLISNHTNLGIRQVSNINPMDGTGATPAVSYATGDATILSAAMALATNGYIYYISFTPAGQNNEGKFTIRSISADPTSGSPSTDAYAEVDFNGAADNNSLTFRTMAANPDGWIYMTVYDENVHEMYLAKFQPIAGGSVAPGSFTKLGTFTIDGVFAPGDFSIRNGDIAFDGQGNLYALINEDLAGGEAVIFYAPQAAISTTETGVTNIQDRYTIQKAGGGNFSEYVVGLAVASSGNFYVAVQDDHAPSTGGVYLLSKSGNNFVMSANPIITEDARSIADLATAYFPSTTVLPVVYGSISANVVDQSLILNWSTLSETNNSHFYIEASTDGKNFTQIGKVDTKAVNGNSDTTLQYSFTKSINGTLSAMGISLLSLAFVLLLFNRKNKLLFSIFIVAGLGLTTVSCSKNTDQIDVNSVNKLFVRIVQVDKDGKQSTSKTITVYKAD